jgi:hypothetical protein
MRHEVTSDEVQDTIGSIVPGDTFTHLQDVKYGYDEGNVVVFVKDGGRWFKLHTEPPNATITNALRKSNKNLLRDNERRNKQLAD